MNAALFVKTLQVRQQGRLRELHRLWCWPQRSSHGQDQLGYRPCTLTRGPAPKPTQPLFYLAVFFLLFFLRKPRGEVLKKIKPRFETLSAPSSLAATLRGLTLITRTAPARASYPSCVAVYPRDSRSATCSIWLFPSARFRDDADIGKQMAKRRRLNVE